MKKIILIVLLTFFSKSYSQDIAIELFAYGVNTPVEITNAGDNRLFVVELTGSIKVINADGTVNPDNFLTMPANTVMSGSERGFLGLAFHPQYATNGYFFVCYTRVPDGNVIIERRKVNPENPNVALDGEVLQILSIPHPESAHNGGKLAFGPDGYLYIGIGDGWAPGTNAQDINLNLGKILRIDVNNATELQPYAIPAGNPYVGVAGNDEIWAVGLRNPWKYSFDRNTGDLWLADVGANALEEINHVPSTQAGVNYGWMCYEATNVVFDCGQPIGNYTFPMASYPHTPSRCSIIGGYVYTGTEFPNLSNKYIFADLCANAILYADVNTGVISSSSTIPGDGMYYFTTLGQDINGELYIGSSFTGVVYKIVDQSLARKDFSPATVSLTPNPATKDFSLKMSRAQFPLRVTVIDATGKRLMETQITSESMPVNIEQLQSGIYIVNATDSSGATATAKLAVTH